MVHALRDCDGDLHCPFDFMKMKLELTGVKTLLLGLAAAASLNAAERGPIITSLHVGPNTNSLTWVVFDPLGVKWWCLSEREVSVTFTTKPRRRYAVEARHDLVAFYPGSHCCDWLRVSDTLIQGTGRPEKFTHKRRKVFAHGAQPDYSAMFYRVVEIRE